MNSLWIMLRDIWKMFPDLGKLISEQNLLKAQVTGVKEALTQPLSILFRSKSPTKRKKYKFCLF